jgi:AcrR family transcriptional regulator
MIDSRISSKPAKKSCDPIRGRIIAAARARFFAHGFRGITMDDLAGELGMSKKTLYRCFAGKSALLEAVIRNKFAEVKASMDEFARNRPADFAEEIRQLLELVHQNTAEIQPPFVRDVQRDAPELFLLIQSRRRELIHLHFKRLFNRGRRQGTIRKDISPVLMIEILLGAVEAIANPKKVLELGLTPEKALSAVLRIVLEGVMVRGGKAKT